MPKSKKLERIEYEVTFTERPWTFGRDFVM